MRNPSHLMLLLALLAPPALVRAEKLDKEDKKWLDEVRPLMLRDEEALYKRLKGKGDRLEFQKIFWARRDPDLATPENEFRDGYLKDRAAADQAYRVVGRVGSATDCGRAFILLGKPDAVRMEGEMMAAGGTRAPETWTYRDRPGQTFQGGEAVITFDHECSGPPALSAQLDRVAASKVMSPSIEYRVDAEGRLAKLADLLPRDTQARMLFKTPRQDFDLAAQDHYLKLSDGGTALLGLVRGDASALGVAAGPEAKTVRLSVAASALDENGRESGWVEETMDAPVGPDGRFLASFKLGLRPGAYTLKAGAVDTKSGKASLVSLPVTVPDLALIETAPDGTTRALPSASSILLVRRIEMLPAGTASPVDHPFAAFVLGSVRLEPFFSNTFKLTDEISVFNQVYDLAVDAAGKSNTVITITMLRDGRTPVARTENAVDTPIGGSVVGPVPLSSLGAGKYVVRIDVNDKLAQRKLSREAPFEVLP